MHGLVEWQGQESWNSWTEGPFSFQHQRDVIEALGGHGILQSEPDVQPLYPSRGLPPDPSSELLNIHYMPIIKAGDPECLKSDPHIMLDDVRPDAQILFLHRDYLFCGGFHHYSFLSADEVRRALAHRQVPLESDEFLEALLHGMDALNQYFTTRFVFWFSS